jgi:hypothetical protein
VEQDALIRQLSAAKVRLIRVPLSTDDNSIDFARRVYSKGIAIEAILWPQYAPNAVTRAYQPEKFPEMWPGHPLSLADPDLSKQYFRALIEKLETNGIVLAGLELDNEINWAAFNADFPLPGVDKNFGIDDLYHDPEGQQIAKSFLRYLTILAVLKDVRDHSRINRRTPLISAGLADNGPEGPWSDSKVDGAGLNATLEFLRAHGLDNLVDAYGIHTYPWETTPAARKSRLERYAVAECSPANSKIGKPCWITEWGIKNDDRSCPLDDTKREIVIKDMMNNFRELANSSRVVAAIYFSWNTDPWAKQLDPLTVFRCSALTKGGVLALSP